MRWLRRDGYAGRVTLERAEGLERAIDSTAILPDDRADAVRSKVWTGALRTDIYRRTWYGNGTGAACDGCDQVMVDGDIEVDVDFETGGSLRFHASCFVYWREAIEPT